VCGLENYYCGVERATVEDRKLRVYINMDFDPNALYEVVRRVKEVISVKVELAQISFIRT